MAGMMRARQFSLVALAAAVGLPALSLPGVEVRDGFDDGNDDGWTRSDPIGETPFPGVMVWSFPDGSTYRLQGAASPDPGAVGPSRGGSYRADCVYTDAFKVAVEVVGWGGGLQQDIGLLAMMDEVGVGSLDGYAFSYDTNARALFLNRLENEVPVNLLSQPVNLNPGSSYRFEFHGFNGQLSARVYDLAAPDFVLAVLETVDTTHTSGPCGFFVASVPATGSVDATFDNYCSSPESDVDEDGLGDQWEVDHFGDLFYSEIDDVDGEGKDNLHEFLTGTDPTDATSFWEVAGSGVSGGDFRLTFPVVEGRTYQLECLDESNEFVVRENAVFSAEDGVGSLTFPIDGSSEYCRVVVGKQ